MVGFVLVASAQPPATAPYVPYPVMPSGQMGGIDPYATVGPPAQTWAPSVGVPSVGVPMATVNPVQSRGWWRIEYLVWWTEGMDLPPLVTSSPPGTASNEAGVLGLPDTTILFGNQDVNTGSTGGLRSSSGYWFTDDRRFGIESEFFRIRNQHDGFSAAGDGDPIIARPAFFVSAPVPAPGTAGSVSQKISFPGGFGDPGAASGSIQIRTKNKLDSYMVGGRVGLIPISNLQFVPGLQPNQANFTLGYRRLKLEDNVHISEDIDDIELDRFSRRY